MTVSPTSPIVAIATASGRGAIGVVRVSGWGLASLVLAMCGKPLVPRLATHLPFLDERREPIDRGLAIFFPAPHSFTGEDVLELQAHGGPVVLQMLVERVLEAGSEIDAATGRARLPDMRIARPGEFSERAFLNDKIDLAQAEAIADLIDASTTAAARSAARSLDGAFSREIGVLAEQLVELRALVEATLDFPDEEIDFLEAAHALDRLAAAEATLDSVLGRARQGALLREGLQVVIAGQPNVGKSSLLNALAGVELAIVTASPGTTRDKIATTIQIEGVPVQLLDTAGLRDAGDEAERIGVERSWAEIERADALLVLHDATRLGDPDYEADQAVVERSIAERFASADRIVHVCNKIDLVESAPSASDSGCPVSVSATAALRISAHTGQGLDALRRHLLDMAGWQGPGEDLFIARTRHVHALRRARSHLSRARSFAEMGDAHLELFAEELRGAHEALGEITGAFTPDDLLGTIFGRFCIGK